MRAGCGVMERFYQLLQIILLEAGCQDSRCQDIQRSALTSDVELYTFFKYLLLVQYDDY